jgi:hypothetical protein
MDRTQAVVAQFADINNGIPSSWKIHLKMSVPVREVGGMVRPVLRNILCPPRLRFPEVDQKELQRRQTSEAEK